MLTRNRQPNTRPIFNKPPAVNRPVGKINSGDPIHPIGPSFNPVNPTNPMNPVSPMGTINSGTPSTPATQSPISPSPQALSQMMPQASNNETPNIMNSSGQLPMLNQRRNPFMNFGSVY